MSCFFSKFGSASRLESIRTRALRLDEEGRWPQSTELWRQLAERGDHQACHVLGGKYERGEGVLQNFGEFERWFRRAAEGGYADSQAKLGEIYFHGRLSPAEDKGGDSELPAGGLGFAFRNTGVKADFTEAFHWNSLAAQNGDAAAQVRLGYHHATGQGVDQDFALAEQCFSRAASQDHDGGALALGLLYAGGHGRPVDLGHALKWFTISAQRGNSSAQLSLALFYLRGDCVAKDESRAAELLAQAAEGGQLEAMYLLGQLFRFGLASNSDSSEAETWLRRAAVRGHLKALTGLGCLLLEGPTPDPVSASVYIREAAEAGDSEAQLRLAEMYVEGRGVPRDERLAIRWFTAAADAGSAIALERLGTFYAEGVGVRQDNLKAREWFERAAASGNRVALYNLGVLEEEKSPLERDLRQAQKWYELAAEQGSGEACLRLGFLALGSSIVRDGTSPAEWFRKGAELGNLDAMSNFGLLCVRGEAGERTQQFGLDTLESAASQGSAAAAWALHRLYSDGQHIERNELKADHWLSVARADGAEIIEDRAAQS